MKKYKYVVFNNPIDGMDAEFNAWYDNQHLHDIVKIPGIIRATRFRVSEHQRAEAPQPWKYMALYDCETDDIRKIIHELRVRPGTPSMPKCNAMQDGRFQCFVEPIEN
jgi:hypothetical protein